MFKLYISISRQHTEILRKKAKWKHQQTSIKAKKKEEKKHTKRNERTRKNDDGGYELQLQQLQYRARVIERENEKSMNNLHEKSFVVFRSEEPFVPPPPHNTPER